MAEDRLIDTAIGAAAGGGSFAGVLLFARWIILWLTGRYDRRQAVLDAQDAKQDLEWQKIRVELRAELDQVKKENRALHAAFHLAAAALIRADPQNPALGLIEQIMAQAFPLDLNVLAEQAGRAVDAANETP